MTQEVIQEEVVQQDPVEQIVEQPQGPTRILVFTSSEGEDSETQRKMVEEGNLDFQPEMKSFETDTELVEQYGVFKAPMVVVLKGETLICSVVGPVDAYRLDLLNKFS
jgi:hypothetical protein